LTGSIGSVLLEKFGWASPFSLIGLFTHLSMDINYTR